MMLAAQQKLANFEPWQQESANDVPRDHFCLDVEWEQH